MIERLCINHFLFDRLAKSGQAKNVRKASRMRDAFFLSTRFNSCRDNFPPMAGSSTRVVPTKAKVQKPLSSFLLFFVSVGYLLRYREVKYEKDKSSMAKPA
jgi:hypothetical protein